ncbi:MAG: hypothetical protein ACPL1B_05810 [Thermoprotei archaeon]
MGLSIVASGAIILIVLISVSFSLVYINAYAAINNENTYRISRTVDEYRFGTLIKITNVTFVSLDRLNVTVKNIGNTKIWRYQFCDVMVSYTANVSGTLYQLSTRLVYSSSGGIGTWSVLKIVNDFVDPGILNPNESMILSVVLPYSAVSGTSMVLVFVTDNGVWNSYGVIVP